MSHHDSPRDSVVSVSERVQQKLTDKRVPFRVQTHAPVYTSQEAAAVRGTSLASGAKALILMVDGRPAMFVLPADRKLDNRKLKEAISARSVRFASPEEVLKLTGLTPGSIPPFGSLFQLPTYCDPALALANSINFNAGDHTISVSVSYADFLRVECPQVLDFAAL